MLVGYGAAHWLGLSQRMFNFLMFCAGMTLLHGLNKKELSKFQLVICIALMMGVANGNGFARRQEIAARTEFPELSAKATGEEIATAYKPRFYFISTRMMGGLQEFTNQTDGAGSGLMLARDRYHGLIVTNRHVIDPVYFAKLENLPIPHFSRLEITASSPAKESNQYQASIVAVHQETDLALLLINSHSDRNQAVRIAQLSSIPLGSQVFSLGNPHGLGFRMYPGTITNEPHRDEYVDHSCQLDPGYSGGPLILQSRGLFAGVNTLGVGRGGNLALPAEQILPVFVNLLFQVRTLRQGHPRCLMSVRWV